MLLVTSVCLCLSVSVHSVWTEGQGHSSKVKVKCKNCVFFNMMLFICFALQKRFKDGVAVDLSDDRFSMTDDGFLLIADTQTSDEGKYMCVAHNELGRAYSHEASLYVRERMSEPHFTIRPESVSVQAGGDVSITCQAEGINYSYNRCQKKRTWGRGPKNPMVDYVNGSSIYIIYYVNFWPPSPSGATKKIRN